MYQLDGLVIHCLILQIEINQTGHAATQEEPDQDDDGPTIINFEEFEAQFLDNPNIQDTVAEGSLSEESMNITEPDGEFNGNVEVLCLPIDLISIVIDCGSLF